MSGEQSKSFIKGAAILSAATLIVKILGLAFSIPLANIISVQGMSYFYAAYDIFLFFLILTTGGLPIAVSKMVGAAYAEERYQEMRKIFKVTVCLFFVLGSFCTFCMMFWAEEIAIFRGNENAVYCIIALAPTLFFMSITSAFRGYFQGLSNMVPTATSQVIEATVKILIGVGLAVYVLNLTQSDQYASAAAIASVSISSAFATFYMIFYKLRANKKEKELLAKDNRATTSSKVILKNLIVFAVPIVIGSCFLSFMDIVDGSILMARLEQLGYALEDREWASGILGHAKKFFDLPCAFVVPVATSLLPILSGAVARRDEADMKKFINLSMRVTLALSIPASVAMVIFAFPISNLLLYSNYEAAVGAAPLLTILSLTIAVYSCLFTTNTTLQAFGKSRLPVFHMGIGAVVRVALSFVLIGVPSLNVMGSVISTAVSYIIILSLNLRALNKYAPKWDGLVKCGKSALLSALVMGASSYVVYFVLEIFVGAKISMIVTIPVAIIIYAISALLFKVVRYEDLILIPKGNLIIKIFKLKPSV